MTMRDRIEINPKVMMGKPALSEYALPSETWREVVARRQRCPELRALLQSGKSSTGVPPVVSVQRSESGTGVSPVVSVQRSESGTGVSPVSPSSPLTPLSSSGPSPAFHPFAPSQSIDITRRNLPHWQQEDVTYFITFRLGDSLPQSKLNQWKQEREAWLKRNPPPWSEARQVEYAERFPRRLHEWLDAGHGSCLLAGARAGRIVKDALRHFDAKRYILDHYVVMPNHVHVLVAPEHGFKLPDILHSWKSYTAHEINKALHCQSRVWLDESFDHIVRSREQLEFYRGYICENPQKAKLRPRRFRLGTRRALDDMIQPAVTETVTGETVAGETVTGETPVPHS